MDDLNNEIYWLGNLWKVTLKTLVSHLLNYGDNSTYLIHLLARLKIVI